MTGASTSAEVIPAARHTAHVTIASANITQSIGGNQNITIGATGLDMEIEAIPGAATSTTVSGTVVVNGIQYTNPPVGTKITVGSWTVALNSQMSGGDGSSSVSFVRLIGPGGEDLRLGWAWVSPVTPW